MTDVRVPEDVWDAGDAAVSAWLYRDGEQVREGDIIAELMVEKSSFEIRAPVSGRLEIVAEAETPVAKGQVIARIG